jgi:hypothetical protein
MQDPLCFKRECGHQEPAADVQANNPAAAKTAKTTKNKTYICASSKRPLSEHSDDLLHTAAKRTEEWVNRPAAVRWRET